MTVKACCTEPGLAHELDLMGLIQYLFEKQVAAVEVDTATGAVELIRHIAVDDCGEF